MKLKKPATKSQEYNERDERGRTLRQILRVSGKIASILGKCLLSIVLIGVLTMSIVGGAMVIYVTKGVDADIDLDLDKLTLAFTSFQYEQDPITGEWIQAAEYYTSENRVWVDYDQIPEHMKDAAIAIEDKRFYEHDGVDWKRTISATVNSFVQLYGSRQGGSTITQQLIKNLLDDDDVSFSRKLREIVRSLEFEQTNSKEKILCAYLNTIALGSGCNGVQAAAHKYFGKDVWELNLAECASIIGITKFPTRYNPLINPEYNKERQMTVLQEMYYQGKISEKEYKEACAYQLEFVKQDYVSGPSAGYQSVSTWYQDMVFEDVLSDLQDKLGYSAKYARSLMVTGGLRIYSAVDRAVQFDIDSVYSDDENFPKLKVAIQPQSAIVVMDYEGRILGIAGGIGQKTESRGWNRATMHLRQTGSSIKPIAVYGPAMEYNLITYSSAYLDSPIKVKDGAKWREWPPNYSGIWSDEPVTVVNGIERSLNTIAARIETELGIDTSFNFLQEKFHIKNLVDPTDRVISAMALGGLTNGLTLREMANAFMVFGNGGLFYDSYSYYRVEDNEGRVILQNEPLPQRTLSSDTAYIMNRAMTQVIDGAQGTARAARFRSGMELFAKSGTSGSSDMGSTDAWLIGGSPYYLCCSWFGFDRLADLKNTNTTGAVAGWKKVMTLIHEELENARFEPDGNVVVRTYCKQSGLLLGPTCTESGSGYYKKNHIPSICDGTHKLGEEDEDESSSPGSSKPESSKPEPSEPSSSEPGPDIPPETSSEPVSPEEFD